MVCNIFYDCWSYIYYDDTLESHSIVRVILVQTVLFLSYVQVCRVMPVHCDLLIFSVAIYSEILTATLNNIKPENNK